MDGFKARKPAKKPVPKITKPAPTPVTTPPVPDEIVEIDDGKPVEKPTPKQSQPARQSGLIAWWKSLNRNLRFGVIAAGLVVFCAVALGIYYFTNPQGAPSLEIIRHQKQPASSTVASPLTGVQVDPSAAGRPVTGIMIENSDFARPQSGLQAAGVVYEAIAEAGITRFLALFQESTPSYIGPVRSLRPYYIDYAAPYQANIVHVGGSPDALREVSQHFRNIDEFAYGNYFYRISTREAPHNMYTNFSLLNKVEKANGWTTSKFTGWARKPDAKLKTPSITKIDLAISSDDFHVHYDYDASKNAYARSEGGLRHTDYVNPQGKEVRLEPKVVVAIVVPLSNGQLDSSGAYYSNYVTSGKGIAYIFQDGTLTKATWSKKDTNSSLLLINNSGHNVKLNAGQTWVTLVSNSSEISYSK